MDHFGGLDVSVKETSICIVDDTGRIVKEVKVASEPAALLKVLGNPTYRFKRIGLEAGPLSQWLFSALAEAGLPVVCVEQPKASGEEAQYETLCRIGHLGERNLGLHFGRNRHGLPRDESSQPSGGSCAGTQGSRLAA